MTKVGDFDQPGPDLIQILRVKSRLNLDKRTWTALNQVNKLPPAKYANDFQIGKKTSNSEIYIANYLSFI